MRLRPMMLSLFSTLLFMTGPAQAQESLAKPAVAPQDSKDEKPKEKQVAGTASDVALDAIKKFIAEKKIDKTATGWKTKLPKPPQVEFDPKMNYFWIMETNKGTLKFRLMPDVAPMHVSANIYLNTLGFYDGLKFHRVIKGFMAQGGDPIGSGGGSPGYQMRIEIKPDVKHDKPGILSTARTNDPTTDGSQFFIMFAPNTSLDGKYTVYGEMVEGTEALKAIEACGRAADPAPPTEEIVIKKGTIEVKPKS